MCLNQVFGVEVAVGPDSLVQVLLGLQLSFEVDVFLLKLANQVLFKLDLLDHLHQVRISFGRLHGELVALLLQLLGLVRQLLLHLLVR